MVVSTFCAFCGQKRGTRVYDRITKDSQQFCSYECYAEYNRLKQAGVVHK